jgi:hypothetical protein
MAHKQAPASANLANAKEEGMLQQCVLWNIGQLFQQDLNFSPYFITSNEDMSLSSLLQNEAHLRFCKGAGVYKGAPTNDNDLGARDVAFLRDRAVSAYYKMERDNPVQDVNHPNDKPPMLDAYIIKQVLPKALENMTTEKPECTESKAVEQLMAKIVSLQSGWVPSRVFRPNSNKKQTELLQL